MGHRIDSVVGIGRVKLEGRVASRPGASSVCRRPQEPAVVVGRVAAPALARDSGLEGAQSRFEGSVLVTDAATMSHPHKAAKTAGLFGATPDHAVDSGRQLTDSEPTYVMLSAPAACMTRMKRGASVVWQKSTTTSAPLRCTTSTLDEKSSLKLTKLVEASTFRDHDVRLCW